MSDSEIIEILPGEQWWGSAVWDGHLMPLQENYSIDLFGNTKANQAQPLLLSNKGRVIWSEKPITYSISDKEIHVSSYGEQLEVSTFGKSLKSGYIGASQKYFPASGKTPDPLLFQRPQYNTWIELIYDQNQRDILKYAKAILENDMPSGVLMIDDNWQEDYGKWEFHPGRFDSPGSMIDSLHQMGFKVMLWICPFVSPDSDVYRELAARGVFVKTADGSEPLMVRWWNGVSAVLDFTNPGAVDWFDDQLEYLSSEYGVDGFKFDAGDSHFYNQPSSSYDSLAIPNDHNIAFQQFGLKYPLNEYRATWKMGGQPLAQRLHDKGHNWEDLQKLIPQIALQGLLGYPFNCPDMIGGGSFGSFINDATIDQDLIVRSAQVHALMPMMQFSVAPWRVLDQEHFEAVKAAVDLREQYLPIILSLVDHAKNTGEPIVRLMEYEFPNQGFEEVKDQFMLGSGLLVAPIIRQNQKGRTVTLPKGKWKYKEQIYRGGKSIAIEVGLTEIPVFEKH